MALAAGLRIEDGPEPIADGLGLFKFSAVQGKRSRIRQAVGLIVVTGWSLSGSAGILP